MCNVGSLARLSAATATTEAEDGELGSRGSNDTWHETLARIHTRINSISLVYGSVSMNSCGWSLIANLLLISEVLMLDYVLECMHVGFMFLVIDIVVVWTWIKNRETWIELLGWVIWLLELIFWAVFWRGSSELCVYMFVMAVHVLTLN